MSLVFSALASLDGYTVDTSGSFDWAAPDEEVHAAVNDRERGIGTYLYGRRMFETMRVWQDMGGDDAADVIRDYADIWRAADKIVYSSSLTGVTTPRTTIEPVFDPAAVRALVEAAPGDVSVGGGLPALPPDLMLDLELLEERSFRSGTVMLRYRVSSPAA